VLDARTAAYYRPLRRRGGRAGGLLPELIEASDEDAAVLGLNAVSDGRTSCCRAGGRPGRQLAAAGFEPVPVDLSELLKAGGGPKCCTLELRDGGERYDRV